MVQGGANGGAWPDLGRLVPHHPPMRLLDGLDHADDEGAQAHLRVDPQAWYADPDGALPGWFGIELMAQTIAAYSGYQKHATGHPPKLGYLLGTRAYRCSVAAFPAHARLDVAVKTLYRDESGLGAFDCTLSLEGTVVALAQVKVFEEA